MRGRRSTPKSKNMMHAAARSRGRAGAALCSLALAVAGLVVLQTPPVQAAPTDTLTESVRAVHLPEPRELLHPDAASPASLGGIVGTTA